MRMWGIDPKLMCRQHLLGEHVEMHMFVGTINLGKSIDGYVRGGLVETSLITQRHADLATEMVRRGMNHRSELPDYQILPRGRLNRPANLIDLSSRCAACAQRIHHAT